MSYYKDESVQQLIKVCVQSGDAWSGGISMSLITFPVWNGYPPPSEAHNGKWKINQILAVKVTQSISRSMIAPWKQRRDAVSQRTWISIRGGDIFLFRTVAEYGLFAALYSSYLWVYPGLFITILKFNSPIMTPLPPSVLLLQSSYLVLLSHWLSGERIRELANCIY